MSNIKELNEQRAKLITDAQAILLDKPDAEKRASAHKMLADVEDLEKDITALKKIEDTQREERNHTAPNRGQIETTEGTGKEADIKAFRHWMQTGEKTGNVKEVSGEYRTAGFTTGGANSSYSGAAFIPQSMSGILTDAKKDYGQILQFVDTINTDHGNPLKIATDNDTANLLSVLAENTAVSEVDPTINSATILNSDFLTTGVVKVSLSMLNQSEFNVEDWLKNAFGLRYWRGLTSMVTNGNSSNIASLKTSATVGATTASATAIAWSDITATYASLDPAYAGNARWSMNTFTRGYLLGLTDTLGRPLYTANQMESKVTGELVDAILGHEVVIDQYLDNANTASNIPVLFGDFSAYKLRLVNPGLSIFRLNELYLASGMIGFIGYAMGGGVLIDAGTHPVVSMQMDS